VGRFAISPSNRAHSLCLEGIVMVMGSYFMHREPKRLVEGQRTFEQQFAFGERQWADVSSTQPEQVLDVQPHSGLDRSASSKQLLEMRKGGGAVAEGDKPTVGDQIGNCLLADCCGEAWKSIGMRSAVVALQPHDITFAMDQAPDPVKFAFDKPSSGLQPPASCGITSYGCDAPPIWVLTSARGPDLAAGTDRWDRCLQLPNDPKNDDDQADNSENGPYHEMPPGRLCSVRTAPGVKSAV